MRQLGRLCTATAIIGLAILSGCGGTGTLSSDTQHLAEAKPVTKRVGNGSVTQLNHIVWMLQENRSFDNYFGSLNTYRVAHGLPADVDGLPSNASNPAWNAVGTVKAFHLNTVCIENVTPSWDESRRDIDRYNPTDPKAPMDGFVYSAAHYAIDENAGGHATYADITGIRAMGYYTDRELPYYYFMASQFATSDRFFSPILSRTPPNRIAGLAASALGIVNNIPLKTSFKANTIFTLLQNAGISWKVYTTSGNTYLGYFGAFYGKYKATHVFPVSQYLADLQNGTLPQVAFIETGVEKSEESGTSELDEHPDTNIQKGAAYVSSLINPFLQSPYWSDSVFILAYDEGGGVYDHVAPQPAKIPDSIPPMLAPNNDKDTYSRTGFRIPIIVISPFANAGYVSHTVMDTTAILKFIETRFNLPSLTARDAAQADMSEFFDFVGIPNQVAPTPPVQPTNAPCTIHKLP
jgi:phospholipase C